MTISFDPSSVYIPVGHFIGSFVELAGDEIPVLRPSDHQLIGIVRDGGEAAVDQAVSAAREALRSSGWSRLRPNDRAQALFRFADAVVEKAAYLAQLEALTSSRLYSLTSTIDALRTAGAIRYNAEYCDKLEGVITPTGAEALSLVRNEPYGIVGAIVPWNFPLLTAVWKVAPALAAGNAIILKTSELTPHSLLALAQIAVEAGLPAGLFSVISGWGHTTGSAIVRHPEIGKISFTGSSATGALIMAQAAASGTKPVTLELGGKSPQLVFADVSNLEETATRVSNGVLANAGQVCTAGSRVIVESSIADALVDRMEAKFRAVKAGPTWDSDTTLPPIISQKQAERIDRLVRQTVDEGATVRLGGGVFEDRNAGSYYRPTILEGVKPTMTGFKEEFFGPVVSIDRFEDFEAGLAMADHPTYGLAASIHTGNLSKALKAADGIQAGVVWINQHGRAPDYTSPQGGYKGSGIGKDMGRPGIEAYLRRKAIWVNYG